MRPTVYVLQLIISFVTSHDGRLSVLRISRRFFDSSIMTFIRDDQKFWFVEKLISENLDLYKLLLANFPAYDVAADSNHALRFAVAYNHVGAVAALLCDKRVDPCDNYGFCIKVATCEGHTEIVKLLLADPRTEPGIENNYALRTAIALGHCEIALRLLADRRTRYDHVARIDLEAALEMSDQMKDMM